MAKSTPRKAKSKDEFNATPSVGDMDALIAFIADFERPGFVFAHPWREPYHIEENGRRVTVITTDRFVTTLPSQFLSELSNRNFPARGADRKTGWSMEYVDDHPRMSSADLATLREMLPDLFFGSRITGGFMANLFESGFWTSWLRRLRGIRSAQT